MLSKRIVCALHLCAALALLNGCVKKASDEIDFGTLNNFVYQNKYFGLSVTLPEDWNVQDQEAQRRLMKQGADIVTGDDKNLKAAMKASELQSVNLFAAFKHPVGTPVPFNPSILCIAERTRELPGIKRGKDYLYQARTMIEAGQIQVSIAEDYQTELLGGLEFDVMELELSVMGKEVKQKYYASIQNGYALCFIVSFTNDQEAGLLQKILDSVAFNQE